MARALSAAPLLHFHHFSPPRQSLVKAFLSISPTTIATRHKTSFSPATLSTIGLLYRSFAAIKSLVVHGRTIRLIEFEAPICRARPEGIDDDAENYRMAADDADARCCFASRQLLYHLKCRQPKIRKNKSRCRCRQPFAAATSDAHFVSLASKCFQKSDAARLPHIFASAAAYFMIDARYFRQHDRLCWLFGQCRRPCYFRAICRQLDCY